MIDAGIVLARFLHYTAVLTLFGVSLFPLYSFPGRAGGPPAWITRLVRPVILSAVLAALLSGVFWFACVVAGMAGTWDGLLDGDVLRSVLIETGFGKVSAARLLLAIVLILIAIRTTPTSLPGRMTVFLSATLLASLAGVGHTQIHSGISWIVHMIADGIHLLAAGAWLGGLIPLLYIVARAVRRPSPDNHAHACQAARRFSTMGYVAVAALAGSGLVNGVFLVGSPANLAATPYGRLLMLKLCLFAAMLTLAALNRFWLVPRLGRDKDRSRPGLVRLCGHIVGEQALGIGIIWIVSALGTMDPAINFAMAGAAI